MDADVVKVLFDPIRFNPYTSAYRDGINDNESEEGRCRVRMPQASATPSMLAGMLFLSGRSSIPPHARREVLPPLLVFPGGHRRRHSPLAPLPRPRPCGSRGRRRRCNREAGQLLPPPYICFAFPPRLTGGTLQHVGRIQAGQLCDLVHVVHVVEGSCTEGQRSVARPGGRGLALAPMW
jgi:hypothetical protein